MALERFALSTIATMDDGRINEAFLQALRRCEDDCKDRPGLKDERVVKIEVRMAPIGDEGDLESVNVAFKITDTVPKRSSKTYNMKSVPGGLLFNDASPEDVRQATLDMAPKPEVANAQ